MGDGRVGTGSVYSAEELQSFGWGWLRGRESCLQPSAATSTKPGAGVEEGGGRRCTEDALKLSPSHPPKLFFATETHSRRNLSCHGNLFFRVSACWLGGDTRTLRISGSGI